MPSKRQPGVVISVGSDRVCIYEDRVIIEAAEMMDWPAREFARVPVYFEGRKFLVHSSGPAIPPYVRKYELVPWPVEQHEASNRAVFYDEDYVAARDAAAREQRKFTRLYYLLLPLYPCLGWCWSGIKSGALWRWGFEPRSITSASLFLTLCLLLAEGTAIGWLAGGFLVWMTGDWNYRTADVLIAVILFLDLIVRYDQLLRSDSADLWGFGEWLWRRRKRGRS